MSAKKIAIQLQDRDTFILCGLLESRIMTSGHIEALYFEGKQDARKQRLRKLKAAGLIGERDRSVNELSVLFLTRKGFDVLHQEGILSRYPKLSASAWAKRSEVSELTIRHELEIMDVKAAFSSAISNSSDLSISEFNTWPRLNEFETMPLGGQKPMTTKPDGFIRIQRKELDGGCSEHAFFLEVDRSTETQERLLLKCPTYIDFYRSGGFALRNGAKREAYAKFPFRLLLILKTAERRNNTALRLLKLNPPIFKQVWLTTMPEIINDPLGKIWTRPVDYLAALRGTAFLSEQSFRHYHSQAEREALIEAEMSKLHLLHD